MSPQTKSQVEKLKHIIDYQVKLKRVMLQVSGTEPSIVRFGYHPTRKTWVLLWEEGNKDGKLKEAYEGRADKVVDIQHLRYGTQIPDGRVSKITAAEELTDLAFQICFDRGATLRIMHDMKGATYGEYWHRHGEEIMRRIAQQCKKT